LASTLIEDTQRRLRALWAGLVKFMVNIYDPIIQMGSFMRIDAGSIVIYQEQHAVIE
jgi:hypothetical protein